LGIVLKRDEAISVLKELLDNCTGLDGHGLELIASNALTSGYQIIIKGVLDEETKQHVSLILTKHQLTSQMGNLWKTKNSLNKTEPDTLILFKPKRTFGCTNTMSISKT
jgi:hypothetical protein